jgi:glycosyltransferase involved in cell wall biosynthesis
MVEASVIVPARDAASTIEDTMVALAGQDFTGEHEVIVVDDGSRDDTVAIAERFPVRVIHQGRLGPGEARNAGARAARGRVLAFTDADCRPAPGWLRAGVEALESADLVQGTVLPDGDQLWAFDHGIRVERESGLYETANLFARRELFDGVGGFEDWLEIRFGKRLGEDVWFGWKARRAGARIAFSHEVLVFHAWIRRGGKAYVVDRLSRFYYPAMIAKIPELRRTLLIGRLFLSPQTATFAAALAGVAGAVVLGLALGPLATIPPLLAMLPYAARVRKRAIPWGRYRPKVVAVEITADMVSLIATVAGSLRYRALLL